MNKYDFELMIELRDDFESRTKEICEKIYKIEGKKFNVDEFDHIYTGKDSITVYFRGDPIYPHSEFYEIHFPVDYLFDDNWMEDYREEVKFINEEKQRIREWKKLQKIKETEQFETDMLKKLKGKYED